MLKLNNNKEIKSLTGIRGLAAIYVALFHSLEKIKLPIAKSLLIFINHGYIAVDLFFILSGFVLTISSEKYFAGKFRVSDFIYFLRKRFARVYPMYLVVLIVGFVFINKFFGKENFIIGLTMLSMLFGPGFVLTHLWSLSCEWVAYAVYPVFIRLFTLFKSFYWFLLVLTLGFVLIWVAIWLANNVYASPPGEFAIAKMPALLKCFAEYILGIFCFKMVTWKPRALKFKNFISVTSSLLIILSLTVANSDFFVIVLFVPLLISLADDESIVARILASRFFYFLGLISYSLYLIHPVLLHYFSAPFYVRLGSSLSSVLAFNIVYLISLSFISYLTYTFIELPMHKFLLPKSKLNLVHA